MSLQRWDPISELTPLREAVNRLLEDSFVGLERFDVFGRTFPVDIRELDTEFVIEASLPGFKPEAIQVTATDNTVMIRAERTSEKEEEKPGAYVRRERYEGEVRRSITLPAGVHGGDVKASYQHGVLMLRVPKAERITPKPIAIEVKPETSH